MQQVELEVAAREHVLARPEVALRVHRQRLLPAGEEVVADARVHLSRERRRIGVGAAHGRAGEQHVDGVRDHLDVPELLGGDVRDQVVERPELVAPSEVEALERVVHDRRHLPELAAQDLLHRGGGVGVRVLGAREVGGDLIEALDHGGVLGGRLVKRIAVGGMAHTRERGRGGKRPNPRGGGGGGVCGRTLAPAGAPSTDADVRPPRPAPAWRRA